MDELDFCQCNGAKERALDYRGHQDGRPLVPRPGVWHTDDVHLHGQSPERKQGVRGVCISSMPYSIDCIVLPIVISLIWTQRTRLVGCI